MSTYSLEEGGIGTKTGSVSIVNTEHFFYDTHNLETPELIPERFISKLYADISISYRNTTPTTPGPDDQYDLEELEDGWRYNVGIPLSKSLLYRLSRPGS